MPTGFKEKIAETLFVLKESLKSFQKNNNSQVSAALAYYGFFAIIPLLLLVIYLLGNFIVSSHAAIKGVENLTSQLFPQFNKVITKEIFMLSRHKGVWGVLSIITLFWAITPLAGNLRSSFLRIFKVDKTISFLKAKLLDAAAVLIILVLFVLLVISGTFYSVTVITFFKKLPVFLRIIDTFLPLLLTTLVMSFFYFVFSPAKLKFRYLLAGSLITAALWAGIRPLFSLFLAFNPNYGFTFGSLKAIFIVFVWVYYSFFVILFGAEVIANARKKDALLLKGVFLNTRISDKKQKRLMKKFGKSYGIGEIIFKEGDEGSDMFFISSGAVSISKKGQTLKVMKEGEYFGEMSMLIQSPRTATATVTEPDTEILAITQDNFELILREEPKLILSVLKEMAMRLKATTEYI
ncbi:MAG: YihY family inner membrane protein [Nitrospirae bacterium]|nr:YihY family inner membrane protein [Nitrospirota bacterium]